MSADATSTNPAPQAGDWLAPFRIDPGAYYSYETARQAIGSSRTTLPREARAGKLRTVLRGGKVYIKGCWLVEWLEAGQVTRKKARPGRAAE
jgi:hypothetical protein